MEFINKLIQNIAILIFCGFMAVFMIPKLFLWIFYTVPQILRYWISGKIRFAALPPTLGHIGSWIAIISVLYAVAFVVDPAVGFTLIKSAAAVASWILALILILFYVITPADRAKIQDDFYENVFLRYIREDEKAFYDSYIDAVGKMSYLDVVAEKRKKLSYLQRKALRNRLRFLETTKSDFILQQQEPSL